MVSCWKNQRHRGKGRPLLNNWCKKWDWRHLFSLWMIEIYWMFLWYIGHIVIVIVDKVECYCYVEILDVNCYYYWEILVLNVIVNGFTVGAIVNDCIIIYGVFFSYLSFNFSSYLMWYILLIDDMHVLGQCG